MTDRELLDRITAAKKQFGTRCKKLSGAMTVEWHRLALADERIPTSARDVYVRGLPIEIDLLVPTLGAKPEVGIVYEPEQVAVALEVKAGGIFGQSALDRTRLCVRSIATSCSTLKM